MGSKIIELLEGKIIVEEVDSQHNGKLTVVKDVAWGTYIRGGGLPQSGGLAEKIWRISLGEIKDKTVDTVLIVGLGGGGIAKIIRGMWPKAKIVGVDIDKVMVDLGKKYLGLDKTNTEIHIEDATKFVANLIAEKQKYDLICVDTYIGEVFPEKFLSTAFLKDLKKLLNTDGVVIYNRLYGEEDRDAANSFKKLLEQVFARVTPIYPEANIMFVCSK